VEVGGENRSIFLKNSVLVRVENGDFSNSLSMEGYGFEIEVGAVAIFVAEFPQF
jgi:hypothetical protein